MDICTYTGFYSLAERIYYEFIMNHRVFNISIRLERKREWGWKMRILNSRKNAVRICSDEPTGEDVSVCCNETCNSTTLNNFATNKHAESFVRVFVGTDRSSNRKREIFYGIAWSHKTIFRSYECRFAVLSRRRKILAVILRRYIHDATIFERTFHFLPFQHFSYILYFNELN